MANSFTKYIDTLFSEKGIDMEATLEVPGPSGTNFIPVQTVVDAIKRAGHNERPAIRQTFVKIDFMNGDIMHFTKHLAQAIAQ